MRAYSISHLDWGYTPDFSKEDGVVKAEDINDLRRKLIAKYVYKSPILSRSVVYNGILRIEDAKTSNLIGYLVFNEKDNGRAYWTKSIRDTFYYPISAKTGRISGEGWDYFRPVKKKKK